MKSDNKHWLLVDDDEDILCLLAGLVENLSKAKIECHPSPSRALAAFVAAPEKYELVITDFQMAEMNGLELCRRLRAIAPAQKIILATGSEYFTSDTARRAGFNALLNKPFLPAELQKVLAETGLEPDKLAA